MAALKLSLQLFLLLASIAAPHVITARVLHTHKSSHLQFPQHLQGSRKGNNIQGIRNVRLYLQRYGYLANTNTDPDVFDDQLESAIETFQRFYKLNASGVLDKETLALMSRPRCGVPDISNHGTANQVNSSNFHSYFTFFSGAKWPIQKYHLTYVFLESFPTEFVATVTRSMEEWAAFSKFTFSEASEGEAADIKLSFERGDHGDKYPFEGKGGALAHAFGPMDGRVHFDADESWAVGVVAGSYNVGMAGLHELGHVLGLGHSEVPEAVMWPYIDAGDTKVLHFDDIQGIQALYSP